MPYSKRVWFSSVNNYGSGPADEDDVYTVEEFKRLCEQRSFLDYDGFFYPVKASWADPTIPMRPSQVDKIPDDATHIVWFNR